MSALLAFRRSASFCARFLGIVIAEYSIHASCSLVLQHREHVAVEIHRDADAAVSENLHHHARVDTLDEEERRAGMTHIMEALMPQPCPFERLLKASEGVARLQERATRGWEDESVFAPCVTVFFPLLGLSFLMGHAGLRARSPAA